MLLSGISLWQVVIYIKTPFSKPSLYFLGTLHYIGAHTQLGVGPETYIGSYPELGDPLLYILPLKHLLHTCRLPVIFSPIFWTSTCYFSISFPHCCIISPAEWIHPWLNIERKGEKNKQTNKYSSNSICTVRSNKNFYHTSQLTGASFSSSSNRRMGFPWIQFIFRVALCILS